GKTRQDNYGNMGGRRVLLQPGQHIRSAHLRQYHIQENDIGVIAASRRKGLLAIFRNMDLITRSDQAVPHCHPYDSAIFHQKYALHVAPLPLQMELSAITAESMIGQ